MSDKKKFHIVYFNPKTKESKVEAVEYLTFNEVASHSFVEVKKLWERTKDTWEIVAVYDLQYQIDSISCLT